MRNYTRSYGHPQSQMHILKIQIYAYLWIRTLFARIYEINLNDSVFELFATNQIA